MMVAQASFGGGSRASDQARREAPLRGARRAGRAHSWSRLRAERDCCALEVFRSKKRESGEARRRERRKQGRGLPGSTSFSFHFLSLRLRQRNELAVRRRRSRSGCGRCSLLLAPAGKPWRAPRLRHAHVRGFGGETRRGENQRETEGGD